MPDEKVVSVTGQDVELGRTLTEGVGSAEPVSTGETSDYYGVDTAGFKRRLTKRQIMMIIPAEITAAVSVLRFWPSSQAVPLAAYIAIFLVACVSPLTTPASSAAPAPSAAPLSSPSAAEGQNGLAHAINGFILLTVISCGVTSVYIASRAPSPPLPTSASSTASLVARTGMAAPGSPSPSPPSSAGSPSSSPICASAALSSPRVSTRSWLGAVARFVGDVGTLCGELRTSS